MKYCIRGSVDHGNQASRHTPDIWTQVKAKSQTSYKTICMSQNSSLWIEHRANDQHSLMVILNVMMKLSVMVILNVFQVDVTLLPLYL